MTTPPTSSPLPPDRGSVATERRNPRSERLDELDTLAIVRLINDEDATIAASVRRAEREIAAFAELAAEALGAGGRLIYLGAGTSGRLGVLDASECPPTFQTDPSRVVGMIAGGDAALRRSSESREDERDGAHGELDALGVGAGDAVLGIAAGGTTPYVLGGVEYAKSRGARTGLLVCTPISAAAGADVVIVVETGPEVVTGSTRMKAGTATKLVLNTISTAAMVRLGKTYGNLMVDVRATNDKLRDRAARMVGELTGVGRGEAFELLGRAGGSVKVAAVMHWCGLDRSGAEARLGEAGGVLRLARRG